MSQRASQPPPAPRRADDVRSAHPSTHTRGGCARRVALLLGALLAAAAVSEWLLPSPLDAWIPPLLQRARGGRVVLRAGDDPTRWPSVSLHPVRPRLVWIGASTVVGVPFDPWSSPPKWLGLLLAAQGLDVEVLPVAAPGKTARELVAWLPDVLTLEPDAVILTTGHNEYLDAHRLLADSWLERSALLHPLCRRLGISFGAGEEAPTESRPFDHAAVAGAFRDTLAHARALCAAAGVPLLLTLPVSNLADCPPVLGRSAQAAWSAGRARLEAHDDVGAFPLLRQARDEDAWPARAPARLVDAMRQLGPPLVDVAARFDEATHGRPPGFNLFMDHCHPTLAGQRLLALSVSETLRQQGVLATPAKDGRVPTLDEGLAALSVPRSLESTARARSLRALLHLAFLGEPGNPMIATARSLARNAWVSLDDPVSATLLAVLEQRPPDARAALAAATPSDRHELLRLVRTWTRVAAAFARVGLAEADLAPTPAPRDGPGTDPGAPDAAPDDVPDAPPRR